MKRHYYISDDLNDLKLIETELQAKGLLIPQIHVLSESDAEVEQHHLHAIESVLKKDVVRSTELGAVVGLIAAGLVLAIAYAMQWHLSPAGWIPFGFLAVALLGFCTWEGGLIGIQVPNHQFKRFQKLLKQGKHVFFVDITEEQQAVVKEVVNQHQSISLAGTGESTPEWIVKGQDKFNSFMKVMP
ncbi:NAD/FAD-utilizing enzyme [Aliiglaciecola sp. LCG003]|uniref:NAD/FAD-utilizing enzyme n=1 Tax=Aliiglaciecola sp. LCG003 TaxID=3053655 RepID=UPI002573171D|nr:NAD/FAD-utilizing enzyme [Aliiglaciecola sp. LCG003]WJG08555.1 NAD/FAD-utilizing enzyme [Aliiglaciecola sp. LCG003]